MALTLVEIERSSGKSFTVQLECPTHGEGHPTVLLAHAFQASLEAPGLTHLSASLVQQGFVVLSVSGVADRSTSSADKDEAIDADVVDNLLEVAAWLGEAYRPPAVLVGHSFAGPASILAAQELPTLHAMATVGSPSVLDLHASLADPAVAMAARDAANHEQSPLAEVLRQLDVPLLVLHAITDEEVSIQHAEQLFRASRHPRKAYMSLGQADHFLSGEADARFAGQLIGAWASSLLELQGMPAEVDGTEVAPPRLEARVSRAVTEEGYATASYAGGFPLTLDAPLSAGGTDLGPTPNEILRTALAACTTITLRMYANRKEWPLERIECEVTSKSERKDGEVHTHFVRHITLTGDLDDEQRGRILEIADRCPVHRSLEGTVTIETVEATPTSE